MVVSAPGKRFDADNKVTDLLYLCKTHMEQNLPYEQVFQVVADRFNAMMNLNLGWTWTEADSRRSGRDREGGQCDYIASRGEYLNAILIAAYLGFEFMDPAGLILFDKGQVPGGGDQRRSSEESSRSMSMP